MKHGVQLCRLIVIIATVNENDDACKKTVPPFFTEIEKTSQFNSA